MRIDPYDKPKKANDKIDEEEIYLPSVMAFQPRYKTPTEAVSSKVAIKEPSTFELEPYKEKKITN